jgi:hypothetical protein
MMRRLSVALGLAAALSVGAAAALAHPGQHGPQEGHLLGQGEFGNIDFVSATRMHDVTRGSIADVGALGNYAYLAKFDEDAACDEPENVSDGGVYVVDISNPSSPREVGFIRAHQDTFVGEGVQAIPLTTTKFNGDILVFNNEGCGKNFKAGVSIYDVTNPLQPRRLSTNQGDFTTDDVFNRPHDANQIHSAFAWDAGDRAYVVMTDDDESADVDIMEITDPRHPRLIGEFDLNENALTQPEIDPSDSFLHDMIVKRIDGHWIMLLSYWDGGFVKLNVDNPANPVFLGDSDFTNPDPELFEQTGIVRTPEGNAHQAEFTADDQFIIGTDEDFSPYRTTDLSRVTGPPEPVPETYATAPVGGGPISVLPDKRLNGPVVYGGYGCPGTSAPIPPADSVVPESSLEPGEEQIVVLQRGPSGDPNAPEEACFPGEKADNATDAGYDAVILTNRHFGSAALDEANCGFGAFPADEVIPTVCTTHEALHDLFNRPENYDVPYPDGDPNDVEPDLGDIGNEVDVQALFDGWGYVHLFDANLNELDTFAIPEAMQEAFAVGFGVLSVHEVATDPTDPRLAYLSYYAGGFRSIEITEDAAVCAAAGEDDFPCLLEVGGYLDPNGNNFWGVEVWTDPSSGQEYILGSDRDSGLWIFRQTE